MNRTWLLAVLACVTPAAAIEVPQTRQEFVQAVVDRGAIVETLRVDASPLEPGWYRLIRRVAATQPTRSLTEPEILGVWRDELGVEHVQVRTIAKN